MALSPAEKQRRYRERQSALARENPDVIEAALLTNVERFERGELSTDEWASLSDALADAAMRHFKRAQELAAIAQRSGRPPGWTPPGYRPPGT